MKYNFDSINNRVGTNSVKWDIHPDVIPLWVADMDFQVFPELKEALSKRVDEGIFGYTLVPESYYEAIINWFDRRHHWHIDRSWILYTSGVIPAMAAALKAFTLPGEKVLIQTPVYNCFFSSIANCGCEPVENELVREGASTLLILKISVPIPRPRFFCSVIPIILLAECGLRKNWNA